MVIAVHEHLRLRDGRIGHEPEGPVEHPLFRIGEPETQVFLQEPDPEQLHLPQEPGAIIGRQASPIDPLLHRMQCVHGVGI